MKKRALAALLIVRAAAAFAQDGVPPDLRRAMQRRLEAVWKKDAVVWSRLTADEFTIVVPEGKLLDKAERLATLKTEQPEPTHAVSREQVQMYGETAVRRFVDGSEWVLEVWARRSGEWRLVAAQVNFTAR